MSLSNHFFATPSSNLLFSGVPASPPTQRVVWRAAHAARTRLPHRIARAPPGPLASKARHGYYPVMDSTTLRTVAGLARKRAARGCSGTQSDGLMRLGAARALNQLAADLEASATESERRPASRRSRD